jgi:hypothetical protein
MKMRLIAAFATALAASACASMGGAAGRPAASADSGQLLAIDHYVRVKSTAPAMSGQTAQVYVRERVVARNIQRSSAGVVLFVHGADIRLGTNNACCVRARLHGSFITVGRVERP